MQNDIAEIQIKSDEITPFVFFSFLLFYYLVSLSYPFSFLYFVLFLKQNSLRMVAATGESTLAARAKAK